MQLTSIVLGTLTPEGRGEWSKGANEANYRQSDHAIVQNMILLIRVDVTNSALILSNR